MEAAAAGSVMTEPGWMAASAAGKWRELRARYAFGEHELDSLAAYCAAWGRWRDAEAWLAAPDNGSVVTIRDDKGNVRVHATAPQLSVAERAAKEMARIDKTLRLRSRKAG